MVTHVSLLVSDQDMRDIKELVRGGHGLNVSDFIRSAIRDAINEKKGRPGCPGLKEGDTMIVDDSIKILLCEGSA